MKGFFILFTALLFVSCSEDDNATQEKDFLALTQSFESIQAMSNSVNCVDATQWTFTPYGTQACGGPQGFIAYPTTIDTIAFLNRIEGHRLREDFLNRKHGVISPCNLLAQPQNVVCINGIATLVY